MKIVLNGKEHILKKGVTLADLLNSMQINPDTVIVELNLELVPKETQNAVVLKENDQIEVLRFVGGG